MAQIARSIRFLQKAEAALLSAIEVYNRPTFAYREETFAILALNAWELLLKAKLLAEHDNNPRCLYTFEQRVTKQGKQSKKHYLRRNRSGAALTHGLWKTMAVLENRTGVKVDAASDIARLQELTIQKVEENPHLRDKFMTSPHVKHWGSQGLKSPRAHEWLEIARHPDILDIIEQLIGPDIILWGTTLFYKRALEGPATPWHRDAAYWPIKPLATKSVWIAVFDSVIENGCLRFILGSHLPKQFGRHSEDDRPEVMFHHIMADEEFDESVAKDVELEPGQMVLFDVYLTHGARPNTGSRPRAGYALRLMPATSHYDHDSATPGGDTSRETKPLFLVRGVDRCGRNDFRRGHALG